MTTTLTPASATVRILRYHTTMTSPCGVRRAVLGHRHTPSTAKSRRLYLRCRQTPQPSTDVRCRRQHRTFHTLGTCRTSHSVRRRGRSVRPTLSRRTSTPHRDKTSRSSACRHRRLQNAGDRRPLLPPPPRTRDTTSSNFRFREIAAFTQIHNTACCSRV